MKVRIEFECTSCPIKCRWYNANTASESCPLLAYVVPEPSESEQPTQPNQNPDFLDHFLGCTLRELMQVIDSSQVLPYAQGGVVGCPSDYDYLGSGYNCGKSRTRSCTACWDQVYTGYREANYTL